MLGTTGHSWQNVAQSGSGIGHKGLVFVSKVIAACGLDLLTKPELLKGVRDEWEERLAGRFTSPPSRRTLSNRYTS